MARTLFNGPIVSAFYTQFLPHLSVFVCFALFARFCEGQKNIAVALYPVCDPLFSNLVIRFIIISPTTE